MTSGLPIASQQNAASTALIHRASAVALRLPEPHRYRFRIQDLAEVMRRWAASHDTAAIAAATGIAEPDVCRIVHADAERRHTARAALKRLRLSPRRAAPAISTTRRIMSSETDPVVSLNVVTVAQQATDIVCAYIAAHHLATSDLPGLIAQTRTAVAAMYAPHGGDSTAVDMPSKKQIDASVQRDAIISFIDGRAYKTLKRHLTAHGLTPDAYRDRYGLPTAYPMVAASYSEHRSAIAKSLGLGRAAPLRAVA